ncbi:MAG TPA: hypothetical protein ENN43_06950 [bacterium]|nr:hypothetical protein [bacterium]
MKHGCFKKLFLPVFVLIFLLSSFQAAKAAYVITSLDYQASPVANVSKIGDIIYFNMAVVDATQTYSGVSVVVSVSTTHIELSDLSFPVDPPSFVAPMYVYDGTRTWRVTTGYTNAAIRSVTLNNANLITNRPVTNYTTLEYADFAAALGTMADGGNAIVDIGNAVQAIQLYDNGDPNHNDAVASDGIYNTAFVIREAYGIEFLTGGMIYGKFSKAGTVAVNNGFTAPRRINIDGKRPSVELVNANPNPFNPNRETVKFYYYLTEDCEISLRIFYGSVTIKAINTTGSGKTLEFVSWDGLDSDSSLRTDGDYKYRIDITDTAGNTGAAYTGDLKITTVDIITTIQTIDTKYMPTDEKMMEVKVIVDTELRNATAANLANLGFDPAVFGAGHYKLYPYSYTSLKLYDSLGVFLKEFPRDTSAVYDEDEWYINPLSSPLGYQTYDYPFGYNPAAPAFCNMDPGVIYTDPDEVGDNDWNIVFLNNFTDMGGGVFRKTDTFYYYGDLQSAKSYIVKATGMLVGKSVVAVGEVDEVPDNCVENSTGLRQKYHAQPSFFYDETTGTITDSRGYGVSSEDRTAMFFIEGDSGVPTPDKEGPRIVPYSEYPSNNAVLEPGVVSSTNYVKVMLTDDGVGAGTTNRSTLTLLDPYGNHVSGQMSWNGGTPGTKTWEVYYVPNNPLTLGGLYKYTIIPRDALGNEGLATTYTFSVADTAIPQVGNMNVQSASGNTEQLSASVSTQINFLVSKIECSVIPGGTSPVDWTATNMAVRNAAGTEIPGTVSHPTGTNLLVFTPTAAITDGSYTIIVTAVSDAGYSGAYQYNFYVTTSGVTYVNLAGVGENSTTHMVISVYSGSSSGITDQGSNEVDPADFTAATIAAASRPAPPANYQYFSDPASFSAAGYTFPINFNATLCSAEIRLHYTSAHAAALAVQGLSESNITMWVWNGTTWTQITGIGNPIVNSSIDDRYFRASVTSIQSANNMYALMYVPPAVPTVVYNFKSTKLFNPNNGPAGIFYTNDIAQIGPAGGQGNVKVGIYTLAGALVRMMEYNNPGDYAFFNNSEADTTNPSIMNYYFTWDGRNDRGSMVRNGMYVIRVEITGYDGSRIGEVISRLIAVVK